MFPYNTRGSKSQNNENLKKTKMNELHPPAMETSELVLHDSQATEENDKMVASEPSEQDIVDSCLHDDDFARLIGRDLIEDIVLKSGKHDDGKYGVTIFSGAKFLDADGVSRAIQTLVDERKLQHATLDYVNPKIKKINEDTLRTLRTLASNTLTHLKSLLQNHGFTIIFTLIENEFTWHMIHQNEATGDKIVVATMKWVIKTTTPELLNIDGRLDSNKDVDEQSKIICGYVEWIYVYPYARSMNLSYVMELMAMCMAYEHGIKYWGRENNSDNSNGYVKGKHTDMVRRLNYFQNDLSLNDLIKVDEISVDSQPDTVDSGSSWVSGSQSSNDSDDSDDSGDLLQSSDKSTDSKEPEMTLEKAIFKTLRGEMDFALKSLFRERYNQEITNPHSKVLDAVRVISRSQTDLTQAKMTLREFFEETIPVRDKYELANQLLDNALSKMSVRPKLSKLQRDKQISYIMEKIQAKIDAYPEIIPSETINPAGQPMFFSLGGNEASSNLSDLLMQQFDEGTLNIQTILQRTDDIMSQLRIFTTVSDEKAGPKGGSHKKQTRKKSNRNFNTTTKKQKNIKNKKYIRSRRRIKKTRRTNNKKQ
jgi:hypothetical protein